MYVYIFSQSIGNKRLICDERVGQPTQMLDARFVGWPTPHQEQRYSKYDKLLHEIPPQLSLILPLLILQGDQGRLRGNPAYSRTVRGGPTNQQSFAPMKRPTSSRPGYRDAPRPLERDRKTERRKARCPEPPPFLLIVQYLGREPASYTRIGIST